MHGLFNAFITKYDIGTDEHKHAIRPDGYCNTVIVGYKTAEIALLSTRQFKLYALRLSSAITSIHLASLKIPFLTGI